MRKRVYTQELSKCEQNARNSRTSSLTSLIDSQDSFLWLMTTVDDDAAEENIIIFLLLLVMMAHTFTYYILFFFVEREALNDTSRGHPLTPPVDSFVKHH